MLFKDSSHNYPLLALSFNHQCEAFYRCDCDLKGDDSNEYISGIRAKGLSRVPILHEGTGERILVKLIQQMNKYHQGPGDSFLDYFQESLDLESSWKAHACTSRITSHNPRYMSLQQEHILRQAVSSGFNSFFTQWEHYKDTVSLVHTLQRLNIKDDFEKWACKHISFLEATMNPQKVITMMHSLVLLLLGNTRKYYSKTLQGIIVL